MKEINFNHLMSFREIAKEKSISKAAGKFRIGQPAMSNQLKQLEECLGYLLFERKNRKLVLTEAGTQVLKCANDVFQSGKHLTEILERSSLTSKLTLNVGALDSVPKHLVLKLIKEARSFGECQVNIREGRVEDLLKELQTHVLDLLISNYYAPVTISGGLFSRSLAKLKISVFGSPKFKHLRQRFPNSINGLPFILPTFDSKLRHDIENFFRTHNLNPEVLVQTQDTSIQKLLAEEGLGLVSLPKFSAQQLVEEGKLINLGTMEGVHEEFWLISTKRIIDNPIASELARKFHFSFQ